MNVWDRQSAVWQAALRESHDALVAGSLAIGAVITGGSGAIEARGRNRLYEEPAAGDVLSGNIAAHAEMNALVGVAPGRRERDLTVYTTLEPCPMCLGAICMSKTRAVHFACRDPWGGCVDLLGKNWYLKRKQRQIEIVGPHDAELEQVIMALQVYGLAGGGGYSKSDRLLGRDHPVFERWAETFPVAVQIGKSLWDSTVITELLEDGGSPADLFQALAQLF